MMISRLFYFFLLVFCLFSSSYSFAARDPLSIDLPDVPAPNGASWYWVGRRMAFDGMPMSIKMFELLGDEEDVERFYRTFWRSEGHGQVSARDFGLYRIIGHDLRGVYTSIQYRKEGAFVKGKIVVTESPGKRRMSRQTSLPHPPGSKIASKVQSRDGGLESETITVESYKSVDFNKRYYENQMDSRGWKLVYQNGDGKAAINQHYQKGSQQLQITIKKLTGIDKNRSQILVHWIK